MPVLSKGNFSINLGVFKVGGDLTEDDRQCAWELYTEIVTRLSVHGRATEDLIAAFEGEILKESLDSLYSFFKEMRGIMRKFPVGRIDSVDEYHLGKFTCAIMNDILRPFLEKWQGKYRHWYEHSIRENPDKSPFDIQEGFPEKSAMLRDWLDLRLIMQGIASTLAREYQLVQTIDKP